jgi:hypothetical protein
MNSVFSLTIAKLRRLTLLKDINIEFKEEFEGWM